MKKGEKRKAFAKSKNSLGCACAQTCLLFWRGSFPLFFFPFFTRIFRSFSSVERRVSNGEPGKIR